MNKAKIVNITGLTKSQIDYLCEHDYIKLGEKYYISKERASKIITQVQANGAEQSANTCNLQSVIKSLPEYNEILYHAKTLTNEQFSEYWDEVQGNVL